MPKLQAYSGLHVYLEDKSSQIRFFNNRRVFSGIFDNKQIPENTRRVFSGISVGNRAGREMLGKKFSGIG